MKKHHITHITLEQAQQLIGHEIDAYDDDGDHWWSGTVSGLRVDAVSGVHIDTDDDEIWLPYLPENSDGYSIRTDVDVLGADTQKPRNTAPEGWCWEGQSLCGPYGAEIKLCADGGVLVTDDEDDNACAPFEALAAFVDGVRRSRGESLPDSPAPVSAPRGESGGGMSLRDLIVAAPSPEYQSAFAAYHETVRAIIATGYVETTPAAIALDAATGVEIPYGWKVGEDDDGPTLRSNGHEISRYLRGGRADFIHVCRIEDDERINVPRDALRAFLALCDK